MAGRVSRGLFFVHLDISSVFSRARLRSLGLGGHTKGGSGEALDFGLETDKVRNLVSGPVGGHGIVCAIDMYVLDGGGDKSGEEPNDLF